MDFVDYILSNYIMFYEIIGLIIILFISAHVPKKMKNYTRVTVGLILFTSVASFIEGWTQTFETLSLWRPTLTAVKYTMYPLILIFIIFIMSQLHDAIPMKWKAVFAIPEIVSIPIYFTSQWTHIVCYFTEDNSYQGGFFSYWPYVVFGFYFILFLIQNISYLKKYSSRDRLMVLYVSFGALVGVIFHMIFNRKDDYTPIFTSSLSFYFLFLYIHMAGIDPLTKLLNRQSYYQEIDINGSAINAVMSVDMNELKYYNDTYGHSKGDESLITISNILREKCGSNLLYRVGGDEFIILYRTSNEEEIKKYIEDMREALSKTEYTCAFGYSMKLKTIDEMVTFADKKMYEDKQAMKNEIVNQGGVLHNRE